MSNTTQATEPKVIITYMEPGTRVRGPGGNWYSWKAETSDGSAVGYGCTERQAREDLTKK